MKIAVLGYGVVGSGVVDLIYKNAESIAERAKEEITIKYILDVRDFPEDPHAALFIKDFETILHDDEVETVVEVIGGLNPAYSFVKRSLLAGKSVVTSNKELVATYGDELLEIAQNGNLNFMFEASVGGGIPIIRPINQCLAANEIEQICGILNGTTNYILTKMFKEHTSFEDALKQAQQLGYAESNPSADVDGIDACRKIAILASLTFGYHVDPNMIQTEGIRNIDLNDVVLLNENGYVVKLLGMTKKLQNGKLYTIVSPFCIKQGHPLSSVDDVFNGILVVGDAIGEAMFYGRGAGKLPTASAVVADVIDCVKHRKARKYLFWEHEQKGQLVDFKQQPSKLYVRFVSDDLAKLCDMVKKTFPVYKVLSEDNDLVVLLDEQTENEFYENVNKIKKTMPCKVKGKIRVLSF